MTTQTEPKRRQPERTVLDDVADLEARKSAIEERRAVVTRTLSACRQRAAAAEEQRKGELHLAVQELRDADTGSVDEQITFEKSEMARLDDEISALRAAVGEVDKQILLLRRQRRGEFVAIAKAFAEEVAPLQQQLVQAARALIAVQRRNAEKWTAAFAGTDRGNLNPELPLGVRVDARLPGGSLATRCTIPRANRVTVNDAELFQALGTLMVLVDHLERYATSACPPRSCPLTQCKAQRASTATACSAPSVSSITPR